MTHGADPAYTPRQGTTEHRGRGNGNRTALRIHAAAFAGSQALLAAVWAANGGLEGDTQPWFIYPLLGWGIGLGAHYAAVRDKIQPLPPEHDRAA